MNKTVDARGMACPLPVVNAKKAAEDMKSGEVLTVIVDNEIAVQNLQRFATHKGFDVSAEKNGEKEYIITMNIVSVQTETSAAEEETEEIVCHTDIIKKGMTVVLSAAVMGSGDERLGKNLMKAFVFVLTKQDNLPQTILCYNKGAFLSCEDADTLADLKVLEAEGVNILTCGTCLDFYGIKDKLAVGTVTNMYEIVEKMEQSKTIIRP